MKLANNNFFALSTLIIILSAIFLKLNARHVDTHSSSSITYNSNETNGLREKYIFNRISKKQRSRQNIDNPHSKTQIVDTISLITLAGIGIIFVTLTSTLLIINFHKEPRGSLEAEYQNIINSEKVAPEFSVFKDLDINNNGYLDKNEVVTYVRDLVGQGDKTDQKFDDIFRDLDDNKDGQVDYKEFKRWLDKI